MSPDKIFIYVNERRTSLAAFMQMKQSEIKTVDASGCTALTELKADAAKAVYARDCTALTELKADAAEYVDTSGCTALTELKADAAKTVDASGCTALTELKADAAKTVYARGCTALTELKADAAEYVDTSGCTALTELKAPKAEIKQGSYIFAGVDSRGYAFEGVLIRGQWRVLAGCRNFSITDARAHWGPGGHSDRKDCLSFVEKISAFAESLGAEAIDV